MSSLTKDKDSDMATNTSLHLVNVTETFLKFTGVTFYQFPDPAIKSKFDSVETGQSERNEIETLHQRPVAYKAFKESVHLSSKVAIPAGDIIMPCFGEVKEYAGEQIKKRMLKTSHNFIIDGTAKANLWIFIQESCNGNCQLKEGWIKKGEQVEYVCCVVAKNNIQAGEILTVDFGSFSGIKKDVPKDCNCGYANCASIKKLYPCSVESCNRSKKPFLTEDGLLKHKRTMHKINPAPGKAFNSREMGQGPIKCTFKVDDKECGKGFYSNKCLTRHVKQVHLKTTRVQCIKCKKWFSNQQNLNVHYTKSKFDCRKKSTDKIKTKTD